VPGEERLQGGQDVLERQPIELARRYIPARHITMHK
jgi:hypothetical protein